MTVYHIPKAISDRHHPLDLRQQYPQTPESIARNYAYNCEERARHGFDLLPPPASDAERLERAEEIRHLAWRVGGYQQLATLVRNIAHVEGEEIR